MTDYQIEEINSLNHPLLSKAIALIKRRLKSGQVPEEAEFEKAFVNRRKWFPDNYHFLIIKENDEVMAAGAGYYIGDINAGFINYIVVDEKYVGKDLGSNLRKILLTLFVDDARKNNFESPIGYLGEVERENPWLKKLIEKFGVVPLDIEYTQPPFQQGKKPIPLVLYFQPHSGKLKIEKKFVEKIVRAIYESVYDIPEINKNLHFKKIMGSLK